MFAVTPEVQMYAQEGRSYALVCALVALATWQFTGLGPDATPGRWFRYGAVVLTAALLHEFAVLALLAHGVALRFSPPRPPARAGASPSRRRPWPWRWRRWPSSARPSRARCPGSAARVRASGARSRASPPWPWSAGGSWHGGRSAAAVGTPALALALLPTAVLQSAAVHQPVYVDRYVLYSHIGLALLVGAALVRAADGAGRWCAAGPRGRRRWVPRACCARRRCCRSVRR
ncbi:hypothetical protein ACFQ60_06170 [Streptomyces zhihengii]